MPDDDELVRLNAELELLIAEIIRKFPAQLAASEFASLRSRERELREQIARIKASKADGPHQDEI